MSDPPPFEEGRGLADEAIDAFVRLARADFSVRLPRTLKKDQADIVAMFVNVIAEELERLWDERARLQQELRAVLEATLDSMVDGVLALDAAGRVGRANRAVATLLGWAQPSDMVGVPFEDLVSPRDRAFAASLAREVASGALRDRDVLFARRSGELVALSVNASPARAADGQIEGIVVVARDERQLRSAQAQLQLSDRLATMGTLAAGVAHEINNPLSFVTSNIDFISDVLEKSDGGALDPGDHVEVMKALRASQSGAERVRLIVRDLRAFTRSEQDTVSRLDPRKLLDSASGMIRNEIRHHATLTKEYGEVPAVDANEAKLVQVLLNLVQNAIQAISPGNAAGNQIRLATRAGPGGEAIIEVSDTGHGIAREDLPHIFEAFFTTKPPTVGTGLGLAICQKIVAAFGGRIDVETEVGRGSTFRVILPPSKVPKSDPAARARNTASTPPAPRDAARRRVLVVDDEAEVGDALVRLLASVHDVVAVTSGPQALQLLRGESFDVILCDLMMPDMTGMELYRRIVTEMPEVAERIVFMTGGAFGSGVEEFLASIGNERIEKPFDKQRVLAIVSGR